MRAAATEESGDRFQRSVVLVGVKSVGVVACLHDRRVNAKVNSTNTKMKYDSGD